LGDRKMVATMDDVILTRLTNIRREFEKLCGTSMSVPTEPKDLRCLA